MDDDVKHDSWLKSTALALVVSTSFEGAPVLAFPRGSRSRSEMPPCHSDRIFLVLVSNRS